MLELVDAALVPGGNLDPEAIEAGAKRIRRDAYRVRDGGHAVVGAWQGLSACYETPDTDAVLRKLDPVGLATRSLAEDLEQVASALERFADDARSLQSQRSGLMARIGDFRLKVQEDPFDGGTTLPGQGSGPLGGELGYENETLLSQSRLLGEQVETAELECANKIKAIRSPATLLEKAGNWFNDVGRGIGDSWNDAVDDVQDGWEDFTDDVADAWDTTVENATNTWNDTVDWTTQRVQDTQDWAGDRVRDTTDWTVQRVEDVQDWIGDRAEAMDTSWNEYVEGLALFGSSFSGTADDPRPQLTQVGAAALQALGAGLDAAGTVGTLGLWDVDLAGDGDPAIGTPVKYNVEDPVDGQRQARSLSDLRDVLWSVSDSYETNTELGQVAEDDWTEGYVRVTKVTSGDGETRMVVSVPGTQPWFPWDDTGNEMPADFIGDLVGAGGGRSTYSDAVIMAVDEVVATDPELNSGTPMLLAGHSLGGITTADLASDPGFLENHNVTHMVTDGAPIDNNRVATDISVLQVQHQGDAVPRLDMEDLRIDPSLDISTARVGPVTMPIISASLFDTSEYVGHDTKVTLPDPAPVGDESPFATNHSHRKYGNSVASAIDAEKAATSGPTPLMDFEDTLRGSGNYLDPDATFEVYDVPVKRK